MKSQNRNLNPTAEAVIAMSIWGGRYSQQCGGSMDFWDKLAESEQGVCKQIAERVREADKAHGVQR